MIDWRRLVARLVRYSTLLFLVSTLLAVTGCRVDDGLPWEDDFSDPTSGWTAETDASAEVRYEDGVMLVLVKWPDKLSWASAGRNLADFHLAVQAAQFSGPDDNEYGVLARMQDSQHFYVFAVSGDGYFRVAKRDGGQETLLTDDWTMSEAIHTGAASNLLEVVCQGETMRMIVNGETLAQVQDGSYKSGDIGLYAGTFREPGTGVEIHFDNLTVASP